MATHSNALPRDYVLGEYHLVSLLGEGGFGITYRAEDSNLNCHVAIKEFLPSQLAKRREDGSVVSLSEEYARSFSDWKRRFLDEARTLARFRHHNIVRVLRFFEANGTAYLVMELEQGDTLEQYLTSLHRPPTQAELDAVLLPVLEGLEAVHSNGFLHRDLKPQNIIIRTDSTPVLIDFGAARQEVEGQSRTLTSIYTPGYAAPEQYAEHGRLGPWTDIFAMGAVLYRAISGTKPIDSLSRLMQPEDPLPSAIAAAREVYRHEFLAGIDAALRVKPDERPQSVAAWRGLLMAAATPQPALVTADAAGRENAEAPTVFEAPPVPARPPSAPRPAAAAPEEPPPPSPPAEVTSRRSTRLQLSAGAAIAVIAAAAVWQLVAARQDVTPPPETVAPAVTATVTVAEAAPDAVAASPEPSPQVLRDCPDCPELVVVPSGSFTMGATAEEDRRRDREAPPQLISFARPFALGRYPVTRGEFEKFASETRHVAKTCSIYRRNGWTMDLKSNWHSPSFDQDARHPVVCISFADAVAYTEWLSRKTGQRYRLPSEAEWEYAARAGSTGPRYWGADSQCAHTNAADESTRPLHPLLTVAACSDGFTHTSPVGSFPANAFGLFDMLGNVAQWTQDCWHPNHTGATKDGSARGDGRCSGRVVRGAAWTDGPDDLRASARYNGEANRQEVSVGFRVARAIDR